MIAERPRSSRTETVLLHMWEWGQDLWNAVRAHPVLPACHRAQFYGFPSCPCSAAWKKAGGGLEDRFSRFASHCPSEQLHCCSLMGGRFFCPNSSRTPLPHAQLPCLVCVFVGRRGICTLLDFVFYCPKKKSDKIIFCCTFCSFKKLKQKLICLGASCNKFYSLKWQSCLIFC